jgi:hypothetical protein
MDKKNKTPTSQQTMTRVLTLDVRAVEGEDRVIELSFSSETPVRRWFGQEILSHDQEHVDLTRLIEVGSVLFAHGRDPQYGKLPVGQIVEAWVEPSKRRGKAKIKMDTDEKSDLLYQKALSGSLKGVSTGYSVDVWEEVAAGKTSTNGRFLGPCSVAVKWAPIEISLEPVAADPAVGVGRSIEEDSPEVSKNQLRENTERKTNLFERQLQINKNLL